MSADEIGAFIFLGVLLVCIVLSGCLTWLLNRCLKKKNKLNSNGGIYTIQPDAESGEASKKTLERFEVSALPGDNVDSFGTYLIHIPGSTALPYCSGMVSFSHPQYKIK